MASRYSAANGWAPPIQTRLDQALYQALTVTCGDLGVSLNAGLNLAVAAWVQSPETRSAIDQRRRDADELVRRLAGD